DDELDDNQYTAEEDEDNVNIKLEDSYLQTLDEGEYTIKVLFANGEATTTLVVTNEDPNTIVEPTSAEVKGEEETNPNTGLKNYMLLLIPIIVGGIAFYCVSKKSFFKI
ncbi:MAG: hypothetical protein K5666_03715, partial [Bacilli bacterium]|nr:hypothetical protein [Bacilli bacterium]